MVMNMNNKNWVSVWGNAVSIAEHHPEAYAKYITLRYPVYIPFDGDTLRFTFDNYCGSEAVTVTRATVSAATSPVYEKMPLACPCKKETICDITFSKNESVTMEAHQTAVSDPVSFPVKKGMTLTVSLYFADFTLMLDLTVLGFITLCYCSWIYGKTRSTIILFVLYFVSNLVPFHFESKVLGILLLIAGTALTIGGFAALSRKLPEMLVKDENE